LSGHSKRRRRRRRKRKPSSHLMLSFPDVKFDRECSPAPPPQANCHTNISSTSSPAYLHDERIWRLSDKLRIAETVMRKLYKRNLELEQEVRGLSTADGGGGGGGGVHPPAEDGDRDGDCSRGTTTSFTIHTPITAVYSGAPPPPPHTSTATNIRQATTERTPSPPSIVTSTHGLPHRPSPPDFGCASRDELKAYIEQQEEVIDNLTTLLLSRNAFS